MRPQLTQMEKKHEPIVWYYLSSITALPLYQFTIFEQMT